MGKDSSIKKVDVEFQNVLNNEYVLWGLRIILVLYAAMVAPNLNREVSSIFDNVIVRLVVACVIVFLSFHDTTLAILLAIAFVVSIQTLNKHKVNNITSIPESFMSEHNESFMAENENVPNESFMGQEGNESFMGHESNESFMGHESNESFMGHESNESFMGHESNESFMNQEGNESLMNQEGNESFMGQENFVGHNVNTTVEESNESFVGNQEKQYEENTNNATVCGGPNNQFTTTAQLNDASNNLVNKNQINSVATFCPELNAQGSNPPQGFGSWDSSAHAAF
jgi:hypothetical protein